MVLWLVDTVLVSLLVLVLVSVILLLSHGDGGFGENEMKSNNTV